MPIKVLHRMHWKDRSAPPCTIIDEYSIDDGATWISRSAFYRWHNSLIEIVNAYPSAKVQP